MEWWQNNCEFLIILLLHNARRIVILIWFEDDADLVVPFKSPPSQVFVWLPTSVQKSEKHGCEQSFHDCHLLHCFIPLCER